MRIKQTAAFAVNISKALMERLQDIARYTHVPIESLVEFALEREIRRKEVQRIKDEISIEEIRQQVVNSSDTVYPEANGDASLDLNAHNCELCGSLFFKRLKGVDGPIFCDNCLALAKGGEFDDLDED